MINYLNSVNDVRIFSVNSSEFLTYGRIVRGYDFSVLISYVKENTYIPESGNIYIASDPKMEEKPAKAKVEIGLYGGMEIQIGYCNGKNTACNGFEYHKGSEINIAVTDFMLVLGHSWDIKNNIYHTEDAKVFFVEKGTAIEIYQTTLHLSPCRVNDEGFMSVIILPKGTNTPLGIRPEYAESENRLLLQKNKWVIAHPSRESLIKQGAFPGVLGENKELKY